MQNQRDQFNANSGLVVAQANAQWRQNLATVNTAAQNESNREFAQTINAMTSKNVDQVWQRERDIMSLAYQTAESNADNATQIILQQMAADSTITAGSTLVLIAGGGKKGNPSNSNTGGTGGSGGTASETGSLTGLTIPQNGISGSQGDNNTQTEVDSPTNPGGGGTAGTAISQTGAGAGSAGDRILIGGQSGTYSQTISGADDSFTGLPTGGFTNVTFRVRGGKGGDGVSKNTGTGFDNNRGGYGAQVDVELAQNQLVDFLNAPSPGWNVVIGSGGNNRNGGTNSLNANGGYGGLGHGVKHGGGGGACTCPVSYTHLTLPTIYSV